MDMFDRAEEEQNAIKRATRYYYAMVARLGWSAGHALTTYLVEEGTDEFWRLVSVENLWGFCLVLAGWFLVSDVPVIGTAVNLVLSIYGLKAIWERLERAEDSFSAWKQAAHDARAKVDLEAAARHFAQGLATGGFALLELVISKASFKSVLRLLKRFPAPSWFSQMVTRALELRREAKKEGAGKRIAGEHKSRTTVGEKLRSAAEYKPVLAPLEGAKKVPEEFSVVPVVVGTAAALGTVGLLYWAATSDSKGSH